MVLEQIAMWEPRAEAGLAQDVRQPIGALVELPVGDRLAEPAITTAA